MPRKRAADPKQQELEPALPAGLAVSEPAAAPPEAKLYKRPLSHSSISMYLECPQKFKFRYIDKMPEQPKWFFSFGQSVHSALEFFYSIPALPPPTLEQVLAHYKENWKREGYKDPQQEKEYFADGEKILEEFYLKHIDGFRLPLFAEYKFELEVEGVPLLGFVDRIDKLDNGGLAILDYKTGKAIPAERLQEDRQLTMYQMAVEKLLGMKVESLTFYHLPTQRPLTVGPRPERQVDALKKIIVDVNENIQKGRFDPTPDEKKCQWCDFKPHCPVFRSMYAAPVAAAPAPAAPSPFSFGRSAEPVAALAAPSGQDRLAELVDRCGELQAKQEELAAEMQRVKDEISKLLAKNGYVRAFGSRFEVAAQPDIKWEFRDKGKVVDVLKRHGLYDRVLKPAAPEVYKLLASPDLPPQARRDLEALGERKDTPNLTLKKI